MISRIQPEDEDFKPYRIGVAEFAEFLGIAKDSAYTECKKITAKLLSRVLHIKEEDRLIQIGWMSSAVYVDGSGMVNLSFDPLLKPYLLQLKSNFTSCKLTMLLSFKSQYTMRVYTLLKQYEKLKSREIEVDLLRDTLGIRKDLHKEYSDFKRHVLEYTKKELAEKSDLYFEYEEIKYGRRVGAILFHIFRKRLSAELLPKEEPPVVANISNKPAPFIAIDLPATPVIDNLLLLVPEQYRTRNKIVDAIIKFERAQGFEYVRYNILYSNNKSDKSYIAFLCDSLENDWGHDWHEQQQKPVKPRVLEIWERQGFKSMEEFGNTLYKEHMTRLGVTVK
jgi:hypothetical protein